MPLNDPVKKSFVTNSSAAVTLWIIKGLSDGQASSKAKRPVCQLLGGRPEAVREHQIIFVFISTVLIPNFCFLSINGFSFSFFEWDMNQKFDISGLTRLQSLH